MICLLNCPILKLVSCIAVFISVCCDFRMSEMRLNEKLVSAVYGNIVEEVERLLDAGASQHARTITVCYRLSG